MNRFLFVDCNTLDPLTTAWKPRTLFDIFKDGFALTDGREQEEWQLCRIACGERLPVDIGEYKAVLISGSHYCIRDAVDWFEELAQFIREASETGTPKIFAGCFGCQMVAFALGGTVDKNPDRSFVLKAENITVNEHGAKALHIANNNIMNVIVSHGDCVRELPTGARCLASSPSCTNELYICGNKDNILCCQSHPEFDYDYCIKDRIWKTVVEKKNRLSEEQISESIVSFEKYNGNGALVLLNGIKDFIRRH